MTAWHWLAEWWPLPVAALVSVGYLGWHWWREGREEKPYPAEDREMPS